MKEMKSEFDTEKEGPREKTPWGDRPLRERWGERACNHFAPLG